MYIATAVREPCAGTGARSCRRIARSARSCPCAALWYTLRRSCRVVRHGLLACDISSKAR
eukprot:4100061-Pyramimonas_sp.AAC.2